MDGRSLAQELGVGHHRDVAAAQGPLHDPGRAHRHGGLVDDDRLARQQRADLSGRGVDVGEVGGAVGALRRGHAQVGELAVRDRLGRPHHEPEASVLQALAHEVVEARLEDGDLAPLQPGHLLLVDVGADHVVADVGEARPGGEADVAGADHRDLAHPGALPSVAVQLAHQPIQRFTVVRKGREPAQPEGGVVEHRVGRSGRRPRRIEVGGGDGPDLVGVLTGRLEDLPHEPVPGGGALVGDVEGAGHPGDGQPSDGRGQVGGEAGAAPLVVDEGQLGTVEQAEHRLHHVGPVGAAHPGRADDAGARQPGGDGLLTASLERP